MKRIENSDSEVLAFKNEDGSVILVSWLRTNIPEKRGKDKSGNVKDTRLETININLPFALNGNAILYDELGNAREYSKIERNKDSITLNDLTLEGGKITIIEITN